MRFTFLTLILAVLSVVSCKENNQKLVVRQLQKVDKTTHWEIQINQPEFSSNIVNKHENCKVFNTFINYMVQRIHTNFIQKSNEAIAVLDSANVVQTSPFILNVNNNVMMSGPRYLSVRLTAYQMLNEAHGMNDFYGLNYDLENQMFMSKKDILNLDKAEEINVLLAKHLQDPEHMLTFDKPTVENVTAVNMTPKSIEFVYAQYILGPYSCGPVIISIPRTELEGLLMLE